MSYKRLLCAALVGTLLSLIDYQRAQAAEPLSTGLNQKERQDFYHSTMGSELIPLDWLKALKNKQTGKPFLADVDRYGLLPDPNNADGLPIGLTAAESLDSRLVGKMVGMNCAACHVGAFRYKDKEYRIDGAPNLFHVELFVHELIESMTATVESPVELFAFVSRLLKQRDHAAKLKASRPSAMTLLQKFESLAKLKGAGDLERALSDHVGKLLKEEGSRAAAKLHVSFDFKKKGAADLQAFRKLIGAVEHGNLQELLKQKPGAKSPLAELATIAEREKMICETLDHLLESARMLKARIELVRKLIVLQQKKLPATPAGPGRVDDFGIARNVIFPIDFAGPLTAPCSIPHLWGTEQLRWTDWDGNTRASIGRSMATALAGGAVFNPTTFESTVPVRNLAVLEKLSVKITAPAWPVEVFGALDKQKVGRGKKLYQQHCAECHVDPATRRADQPAELYFDLDKIATDPARARNYAAKLGDRPFHAALQETIEKYVERACRDHGVDKAELGKMQAGHANEWRTTLQYSARPLTAVWATPPFLHNGSVPTLHDLLLPAKQRPAKFPIGHRDYDPVKLGYVTTSKENVRFTYDTTLPGNRNTGHEHGTALSAENRMALLEYLKSQ